MAKIKTLLVANRGEIAKRIIRTASEQGIKTVAIYSSADSHAPFVEEASIAVPLSGDSLDDTYLNINKIIIAAKETGADAVHPGYGFLAEKSGFCKAVREAGLVFVGPDEAAIELMGNKENARHFVTGLGIACIPGRENVRTIDELKTIANDLGLPLMLKAAYGGGGRGMRALKSMSLLEDQFLSARREAELAFGDGSLFVEKLIEPARHIEVQVMADSFGHVCHLGTRDCSIQRRSQKIIEEAPASLASDVFTAMTDAAVHIAKSMNYQSAGTIEFLLDEADRFYFLEMNTRIQVEHCVTEAIYDIDIVKEQLNVASGEKLSFTSEQVEPNGYAIEARLCAEDASQDYLPQTGKISALAFHHQPGVRIDSGVKKGQSIGNRYDSLLLKVIAHAPSREKARQKLAHTLQKSTLFGVVTNQGDLIAILKTLMKDDITPSTGFLVNDYAVSTPNDSRLIGLAGLLFLLHAPTPFTDDALQSWHLATKLPSLFFLSSPLGEHRVTVERLTEKDYQITYDDRVLAVSLCSHSGLHAAVLIDGEAIKVNFYLFNHQLTLCHDGHYLTIVDSSFERKEHAGQPSEGELVAPMDGAVVAINAKIGERIDEGYCLVTLESMKMEHHLKATKSGIVRALKVKEGQQVKSQQLLMTLEDE